MEQVALATGKIPNFRSGNSEQPPTSVPSWKQPKIFIIMQVSGKMVTKFL